VIQREREREREREWWFAEKQGEWQGESDSNLFSFGVKLRLSETL
jgi:hypothetical protein